MKIFWSYARRDDLYPPNIVSRFRRAFAITLSQVIGKDCEVYSDKRSLKWGVDWKKEIERLIKDSDGLITVVTPSYFNSRMCMYELQTALAENKKILPIYYRKCKEFHSTFKEDGADAEVNKKLNAASRKLKRVQRKDFTKLRSRKLNSPKVQNFLDKMAEEIA